MRSAPIRPACRSAMKRLTVSTEPARTNSIFRLGKCSFNAAISLAAALVATDK
jgi:hypothetical protein